MKIVVPLDMSDTASRAIELGADIARGLGDDLLLVTVSGQRLISELTPLAKSEGVPVPEMIEAYLKSSLAGVKGVSAGFTVIPGENAPEALVDFATADRDVRMVVMATHGRSGVEKWRLGSVTERVVRHASVPVTVVPKPR